ncbi:MAG: hypothetical protein ACREGR_04360, partial [Minisyncoccia bacterium]
PNLNKSLHCGHLRQLAIAKCLQTCLPYAQFVSLLGCHGILKKAQDELSEWFALVGYSPTRYYDVLMPQDEDWVPRREVTEGDYKGTLVWDSPTGSPVVVFRTPDETGYRRATYAYHDLAFARLVAPTYYITGSEQKGHFQALGLADKHLAMGLVVGTDSKKLASRNGGAMLANEAFAAVEEMLETVPQPKQVAWNVLAYNMLATGRAQNVKFDPKVWVKPEAPGLYINYTWARLDSALLGAKQIGPESEMTQEDAELAGFADQWKYHRAKTRDTFDPAGFANYLAELCRRVSRAYHDERIRDGRPGFQYAISQCFTAIGDSMRHLGMFPVRLREQA